MSQIFVVNELLTIGEEIAASSVVERTNDSECHFFADKLCAV